jgi:hypothetical protein
LDPHRGDGAGRGAGGALLQAGRSGLKSHHAEDHRGAEGSGESKTAGLSCPPPLRFTPRSP